MTPGCSVVSKSESDLNSKNKTFYRKYTRVYAIKINRKYTNSQCNFILAVLVVLITQILLRIMLKGKTPLKKTEY